MDLALNELQKLIDAAIEVSKKAKEAFATAEKAYDDCKLGKAVDQVKELLLPCGHMEGTPGDHKKRSSKGSCGHHYHNCQIRDHMQRLCPTDGGRECTSRFHYVCKSQEHEHTYPDVTTLPCGHAVGTPGDHFMTYFTGCQHSDYYCYRKDHRNGCTEYIYPDERTSPDQTPSGSGSGSNNNGSDPNQRTPTDDTDDDDDDDSDDSDENTGVEVGPCRHTYDLGSSAAYYHRLVSCPLDGNNQMCSYASYYVCTPHVHAYPSVNNNNGGNSNNNNNRNNNNGNNNAPTAPSNPTPTPTPTPSYHACGVHQTSVSGDHSLQASCSRDSRCIAQSFYYCQHSSHTYRTAPPLPPPVRCPANSWTNCGGTSSHATKCKSGHTYYTCNLSAVTARKGHQKNTPVVCPAHSWTGCGGTSSHATTCKAGHPYYSCNPAAVTAHKWHVKAGVKCPAHAWTNCNGSSSHQTTCGRGHKYYTCNLSAVRAHKGH